MLDFIQKIISFSKESRKRDCLEVFCFSVLSLVSSTKISVFLNENKSVYPVEHLKANKCGQEILAWLHYFHYNITFFPWYVISFKNDA